MFGAATWRSGTAAAEWRPYRVLRVGPGGAALFNCVVVPRHSRLGRHRRPALKQTWRSLASLHEYGIHCHALALRARWVAPIARAPSDSLQHFLVRSTKG
jgi:hypothetical protein